MQRLNYLNKIFTQQLRVYSNQLPLKNNHIYCQSFFKPICNYQFTKYRFGSKQITSKRHQYNQGQSEQFQKVSTKLISLGAVAGFLVGGFYGLKWLQQMNEEYQIQQAQQEERQAVEKAIDNDDYATEIILLEKNVMENSNFTLEYAFILHFSYVKLQMFEKAELLEKRMMQFYPKQTLIIHRYMACHYLAMENYVIALKHLIYAAKNYPKVSQEDKNQVITEIEPYIREIEQSGQQSDIIKADLLGFLGQIYFYLHLYKESEYFFRQSLQLKPQELVNSFQLAVALLHQQFFEESEQILQNLIKSPEIDSKMKILATEELSIIYLCENNEQKAIDICHKLNPDSEKVCIDMIERTKVKQKKRFLSK